MFLCVIREVMSHPVVTFDTVENVSTIVNILKTEKHEGFPVVQNDEENVRKKFYTVFFNFIYAVDCQLHSSCQICFKCYNITVDVFISYKYYASSLAEFNRSASEPVISIECTVLIKP